MEPAYLLVIGAIWFFFGNLDILTFSHSGIVICFWQKSLYMVVTCYLYHFHVYIEYDLPGMVETR
jgi:hypothetical protein